MWLFGNLYTINQAQTWQQWQLRHWRCKWITYHHSSTMATTTTTTTTEDEWGLETHMSRAIGAFFFCLLSLFFANMLFYSHFYYYNDEWPSSQNTHATSTNCTNSNNADNHTNTGWTTRAEGGDDGGWGSRHNGLEPLVHFFSSFLWLY